MTCDAVQRWFLLDSPWNIVEGPSCKDVMSDLRG